MIKSMGEKCKVSIRNIRREANEELKKLLKQKKLVKMRKNLMKMFKQLQTRLL